MSESNPVVSILMNCHNGDRFLVEAIDSIYAQTYNDWEIVFWDNASTDRSPEIAKSYDQRLKYYSNKSITSLGEARNSALQKASGKFIAFLDCDDIYLKDKLDKQVHLMESGNYALCYGSVLIIDESGKKIRNHFVRNKSGYLINQLLRKYEINMQSVMIKKAVIDNERLEFETHLKYSPDFNLFMNIAAKYPIGVIGDFLAKYRICSDSLSKNMLHLVSSEIKFTLDSISKKYSYLTEKHTKALSLAYAKLNYYDAIYLIDKGSLKEARKKLFHIIWFSPKYLALLLLTYTWFSKERILRLLRR